MLFELSETNKKNIEIKEKLLYEFNNTESEYPKDKTIHELFEEQVWRTPDNLAVVFEEEKLTYKELNEKSNQLARILREKGIKQDDLVAIMVERSLEMIVGILGILKAGGAYVPIDPNYPKERIKYMLDDSSAKVLLTQNKFISEVSHGNILDLEAKESYDNDGSNLEKVNKANDLAYIIYTSGTTGKSKGVMIEHKGVVNLVDSMKKLYRITLTDKIAQFASISFDAAGYEWAKTLLAGASLIILNKESTENIEKFVNCFNQNKVSIALLPPTFLSSLNKCYLNSCRVMITGGSATNNRIIKTWKGIYYNAYGPTENSIISTIWKYENKTSKKISIGKSINNTQIYILTKDNKLSGIGVPGELCISGVGLARGYLNRPELTAEKFVTNPYTGERMYKSGDLAKYLPDGNIEYLGRIDHQVKIRGFRIELGEIETQFLKLENIKSVIVVAIEKNGDKALVAYYVSDENYTIEKLREELGKSLPEYMIPSFFMKIDKLPLTPNGKIDRKALPIPEGNINLGTEYMAPRNEIEEKLVKIWEEVLGVEQVGINDNFFSLGGDSIKAIRLIIL